MKAAAVLAVTLALAAPAAAKDIRVAADGSGDYKKLSKALDKAVPGDVIILKKASGVVGAILKAEGAGFLIEGTVAGSPAEAAGLKKGDRLLAVDGVPTASRSLPEVVMRVRGPVGTTVELTVAGASGERVVPIVRGEIRREIKDELSKMRIAQEEEDFDAAADYAQKLAEGGALDAQALLAFLYHNGQGVKKDPKKAFFWAARAAESGDAPAQRLLGLFYQHGTGTAQDQAQALYWHKKAVEKNDAYAMLNLAAAYENGWGVQADPAAALELCRRALKQQLIPASAADAQSRVARLEARLKASDLAAVNAAVRGAAAPAPVAPPAPAAIRSDVDDLPAQGAARPHAVAVVIGVERYRENLPKADFAAGDARLAGEYFRRVLGVAEENIVVLTDDRATKSDFEKYFEQWLPNHADKDSEVFVFFSGHGAPDPAKGDAYLVPYDGDPTYIKQTGYSVKRLYALLGKLPAKSVTVALDSCFSGAGGRSVLAKGARPLVTVRTDAPPARVTVLAAAAGDQISNSYQEQGHGLFTYFLLKGLKEKGDFKSAYDYLGPEVSRTARRKYNSDQTPQWRDGK
ncbi:MAG: SEL1-like repeat protein [Elusimicrobia bacterium]|nr:SEL1-like repeat protein [Elusimicrobiota bacterium]